MDIEISSITVTFNPDIALLSEQLASNVGLCNIVIVDNGSSEEILDQIQTLANQYHELEFIPLGQNTGIANAQNTGIDQARILFPGTKSILLLDQDSVPDTDMVNNLKSSLDELSKGVISAVGPSLVDQFSGSIHGFHQISGFRYTRIYPSPQETNPIEVCNLNSSGLLVDIRAFDIAGNFEKDLFIDHVETEWCYRAKSFGI